MANIALMVQMSDVSDRSNALPSSPLPVPGRRRCCWRVSFGVSGCPPDWSRVGQQLIRGLASKEHLYTPKRYRERSIQIELAAIFKPALESGFVAFVEGLPGSNTQGEALDEAQAILHEAAELVIKANRALAAEVFAGAKLIREPVRLTAW